LLLEGARAVFDVRRNTAGMMQAQQKAISVKPDGLRISKEPVKAVWICEDRNAQQNKIGSGIN